MTTLHKLRKITAFWVRFLTAFQFRSEKHEKSETIQWMVLLSNLKEKIPHFRNVSQDCFSTAVKELYKHWTGKIVTTTSNPGRSSFASRKNYNLLGNRWIKIPPGYFATNNLALRLNLFLNISVQQISFLNLYDVLVTESYTHDWTCPFTAPKVWVMLYSRDAVLKQEPSAVLL